MRGALAALLFALAAPLAAQDDARNEYRALRQLDQRLFETGWRLATANAAYCSDAAPSIGVLWQDLANYADRDAAREALGARGTIFALAIATGAPATAHGFGPGTAMYGLDGGVAIEEQFPETDPAWKRIYAVEAALGNELAREGVAAFSWSNGGERVVGSIRGVPACRSRFEIGNLGERAVADGTRVVFGQDFPGFAYPDDEFAAVVAHELAHNLLGHRAWLDANGRSHGNIRLTEREADRLAPWLLANAGHDPEAAIRAIARLRPDAGGGLFRKRTHRGWDERVETIAAEIERMRAAAEDGKADWSRHFQRDIGD